MLAAEARITHELFDERERRLAMEREVAAAAGGHTCLSGPSYGPEIECPACAAIRAHRRDGAA